MTLQEMKKKYLALIEELNPLSDQLTDDPDIAAKQNNVVNQIMFELARMKKIPKYVEIPVKEGQVIEFEDLEKACGYEVYQISLVGGVRHVPKASGTVLKFKDSGIAEIDLFVYPERITEKTSNSYEFELSPDVLEIMPYGIAADLLKSDVSSEYGSIYATRYETMLQRLDPRHSLTSVFIEGGVD
jgi:hypothetical protein